MAPIVPSTPTVPPLVGLPDGSRVGPSTNLSTIRASVTVHHRKKLRRYEIAQQPRFLTCSCHDRLPLFQNDRIKDAFVGRLQLARQKTRFRLLAWVIMPEHFHLIIVPTLPAFPIAKVFDAMKGRFAAAVLRRWVELRAPILKRLKHTDGGYRFWQHGGGYDRNIRDEMELYEKIDYCHHNPSRRGLVSDPLDWMWSSARWYAGLRDGTLEIDPVE